MYSTTYNTANVNSNYSASGNPGDKQRVAYNDWESLLEGEATDLHNLGASQTYLKDLLECKTNYFGNLDSRDVPIGVPRFENSTNLETNNENNQDSRAVPNVSGTAFQNSESCNAYPENPLVMGTEDKEVVKGNEISYFPNPNWKFINLLSDSGICAFTFYNVSEKSFNVLQTIDGRTGQRACSSNNQQQLQVGAGSQVINYNNNNNDAASNNYNQKSLQQPVSTNCNTDSQVVPTFREETVHTGSYNSTNSGSGSAGRMNPSSSGYCHIEAELDRNAVGDDNMEVGQDGIPEQDQPLPTPMRQNRAETLNYLRERDWELQDESRMRSMVNDLANKGGNDFKTATRIILAEILPDYRAEGLNWTGRNGKIAFKNFTTIHKVIFGAVKKRLKRIGSKTFDELTVRKYVQDRLKAAPQNIKRRNK